MEDSQGDFAVEGPDGSIHWGSVLSGAYKVSSRTKLHCSLRGLSPPNDLGGMDPSRMDIRTDTPPTGIARFGIRIAHSSPIVTEQE